jgi:16S rRNA processing protein RimM
MSYKTGILLGRIIKVKDNEGAVTIRLEKSFTDKIPEMKSIFLEIEGKPVPFIISRSVTHGEGILKLKFKGYDTIEKIHEFNGCRVFLNSGEGQTESSRFADIIGFKVASDDNSFKGTIKDLFENPGQWLLNVEEENGETILIPLHEDLIIKVDKRKRLIIMNLPEGLTEINYPPAPLKEG